MKEFAENYLGLIFKAGLTIVILSSLFLFTNLTTEPFDSPKFIVLLAVTGIFLVILALRFTISNKVVFIRTPLDLPLLLLLAVGIISTIISPAPYVSLLGNQLRVSTSLVALIVYILFYFILTNSLKSPKEIRFFLNIILGAGTILSAVSLLSFFGITFLPKEWVQGQNFTTSSSPFSTTAILALMLPILISGILQPGNILFKSIYALLLTIFGITIALTGIWAIYIAAVGAVILTLVIYSSKFDLDNLWKNLDIIFLAIPIIIVALVITSIFIPSLGGTNNPIYNQSRSFPREIQLPFITSWKISVSAFRDSPFWGTGPSTYLFNFTLYKPIEFNQSKFWNLRFDSAFNEYLQVLGTLGGVGILALLSLTALFLSSAYPKLLKHLSLEGISKNEHLIKALAVSGIVFFILLSLHTSSLSLWVIGLIVLASFMTLSLIENPYSDSVSYVGGNFKENFLKFVSSAYSNKSISETIRIEAFPSVLLTVALGLVLFTFYFGGKFVLADYHHKIALKAVSQNNGLLAYNELVAAEKFNSINDLYRTDLAQINFALANAIALSKGPTEASPSGSLTDQDKQNIQTLLQQSINEARTGVTLSPRSALNWEILALLYRQIAGVAQNALLFSLDSYGRAIFQDPLNPQLRVNVGGTYYAIQNYDLAIRFFTDAINLKPDFANGFYNLSVALRDKGDLNTALQAAERVVALLDSSDPDYKVATDYLNDLKSKVEGPPKQPPAATASGELQNEQLPKVIELPKPEKIATPEAIKKPSPSPTP